ncbi:MAG TPA: hypothetical protein VH143_18850, partial [Kofleriaceae bacterium]|nr:hypothetical protein [Kofleriaceae bacterium]
MRGVCLAVLFIAATANADDIAEPHLPAPPSFVTLDRQDPVSRGGVELSYFVPNTASGASATLMRFEGHAQYVDRDSGIGGYAQLPISYLSETAGTDSDSETGIGDLEVGALYLRDFSRFGVIVVGHGGVSLPTGSTSDQAHFANFAASVSRLPDLYLSLPRSTAIRLGVSPLWQSGRVFARADFGLDVDSSGDGRRYDTALRIDAGLGVMLDPVALTAEMTNDYDYTPSSTMTTEATGSSWIDTVAIAARLVLGHVEPYAALVVPIDADSH